MHATLSAWFDATLKAGRGYRKAGEEQFAAVQRQAVLAPAEAAALRLARAVTGNSVVVAWHMWVAVTHQAAKEALASTHANAINEIHERHELLVGITLLIWTQEKTLAFARTALIAWCWLAVRATRDADVAALASDRAILEEATNWEQSRRLEDVDMLVNRVFLDHALSWYQVCFLEWKMISREVQGERLIQELQFRELQAHHRVQNLVRAALNTILQSKHQIREEQLVVVICFVSWRCRVLEGGSAARQSRRRLSGRAGSIVMLLHDTAHSIWCKVAFFAWQRMLVKAFSEQDYVEARRKAKHHAQAVAQSFVQRLSAGQEMCVFLAWRSEVASALVASAASIAQNAVQGGSCGSPVWSLIIRGFLLWRCITSQGKREGLKDDLQMMVMLLQQTSVTIEQLRVRLMGVRIHGIIRRQVFTAWHHMVEERYARQIASATQSVSSTIQLQEEILLSRGVSKESLPSRTPSVIGDSSSRPRTPNLSAPFGDPRRQQTPSVAGSADNSSRPPSRQNSKGHSWPTAKAVLAIGNDDKQGTAKRGGGAVPSTPPLPSGPVASPSAPSSAAASRDQLVRQLQQAREALHQPRRDRTA